MYIFVIRKMTGVVDLLDNKIVEDTIFKRCYHVKSKGYCKTSSSMKNKS